MIQEIITYLILLITLTVVINNAVKFFRENSGACSGCPSGAGCKVAALKHKMNVKR